MLCLLSIAWTYGFGDPGETWQAPVHGIMKNVDF